MTLLFDTSNYNYDDLSFEDDGTEENSVCSINYSADYKQIHLAWIQIHEEISERAFHLSKILIEANPSHYTVYIDRLRIAKALSKSLVVELQFISNIIVHNLKNYQVWNYRQTLVMQLIKNTKAQDGGDIMYYTFNDESILKIESKMQLIASELFFVHETLKEEPKNYHAFTYLCHLLPYLSDKLLESELEFTKDQIIQDVYNNSIWHYRLQLLKKTKNWKDSEVQFIIKSLEQTNNNESVWAHAEG